MDMTETNKIPEEEEQEEQEEQDDTEEPSNPWDEKILSLQEIIKIRHDYEVGRKEWDSTEEKNIAIKNVKVLVRKQKFLKTKYSTLESITV